jgi:hypothetical protein
MIDKVSYMYTTPHPLRTTNYEALCKELRPKKTSLHAWLPVIQTLCIMELFQLKDQA